MRHRAISFPYERRASVIFGAIRRPVAQVELHSSALQRWIVYTAIVDSGADYCVFPLSAAWDLGVSLKACEPHAASGVGGQQRVWVHRRTRMRLGRWQLTAPVGFVERESIPPLLGRYRCLDAFDLRLRNHLTTFSKLPRFSY